MTDRKPPTFKLEGHAAEAAKSGVQCCASCMFWKQRFPGHASWLGGCHLVVTPIMNKSNSEPDWPTPHYEDWCGQWRERPGLSPPGES